LQREEQVRLLDVRSPQEWETAHIQGAQLVTVALYADNRNSSNSSWCCRAWA